MDQSRDIVYEEVVEEVIDDGSEEVYEEVIGVIEGDDMILEQVEEISVDDVDYESAPEGGGYQYVMHNTAPQVQHSRMAMRCGQHGVPQSAQQQRPMQSQRVYAIRGSQVYRVDKPGGVSMAVRPVHMPQRANIPLRHAEQTPSRGGSYYSMPSSMQTVAVSQPRISIAYRSEKTGYEQNRMNLTPFLDARMAQQKKRQGGIGMDKPCNCKKSMCLKLYCDCFANGVFCEDCNCKDCHNNLENEAARSRAIKASLQRNPDAFKPRIGVASGGRVDSERLHQKGCQCKKSNCLKNYCECYEAKVPCTERCKCCSCRNTETDCAARVRGKFSLGADVRQLSCPPFEQQRIASPSSDDDSDLDLSEPSDPKTLPWFYMTDEVVEASTLCLVAQVEEVECSGDATEEQLERAVLEEFGRCLEQVIVNASNTPARH